MFNAGLDILGNGGEDMEFKNYLTLDQCIEKFKFLTKNRLKNLLHLNPKEFRQKVVKKLGRRIIIDESALQKYLDDL